MRVKYRPIWQALAVPLSVGLFLTSLTTLRAGEPRVTTIRALQPEPPREGTCELAENCFRTTTRVRDR